jgi:iron complex outermembrane receptor protein
LKPAYVHTVEAQVSYRPRRYVVLTTGPAYSYLLNEAEFVQRDMNQVAMNISQVESLSWETEIKLDYKKHFGGYGNFAVNRTVIHSQEQSYFADLTNYPNTGYPKLIANLGLFASEPRLPLRLAMEFSYVSSRASSSSNTIAAGQRYNLPAYMLVGGSLGWSRSGLFSNKATSLTLVARNLANIRIVAPGFGGIDYPQLGRTVMLVGSQNW